MKVQDGNANTLQIQTESATHREKKFNPKSWLSCSASLLLFGTVLYTSFSSGSQVEIV